MSEDTPREDSAPHDPAHQAPARARGMQQVLSEDFDAAQAVGGVRGIVEAVAPGAVFLVAYLLTEGLTVALVLSLAVAGLATIARLIQRTPITQAIGGFLGVGIGVLMAWRSGQAEDFFLWGLLVNGVYALALIAALLARWPAVGVVVALLRGQDMSWRTDPALRAQRTSYTVATWLWVGLFLLRLAVQVPLYLAGNVAALGVARLVMGIPLWGLVLWLTWLLVRAVPGHPAQPESPGRPGEPERP